MLTLFRKLLCIIPIWILCCSTLEYAGPKKGTTAYAPGLLNFGRGLVHVINQRHNEQRSAAEPGPDLERGVLIDMLDITPLMLAVQANNVIEIQRIGGDDPATIELGDRNGQTALHRAVRFSRMEAIRALIEIGADINALDAAQKTPLDIALARNYKAIIALLIGYGAHRSFVVGGPRERMALDMPSARDVNNDPDAREVTPLMGAARDGDAQLLFQLTRLSRLVLDINRQDFEGRTALHYAAAAGSQGIVDILVNAGARVDAQDHQGMTPLFYAVTQSHQSVASLLSRLGANPNIRGFANVGKRTLLSMAILNYRINRNLEAVRLLLELGADPNEIGSNAEGYTPLGQASAANHVEVAAALIDHGAEVNGQDLWGRTPLQIAARIIGVEMGCLLLKKGADVNSIAPNHRLLRLIELINKEEAAAASL